MQSNSLRLTFLLADVTTVYNVNRFVFRSLNRKRLEKKNIFASSVQVQSLSSEFHFWKDTSLADRKILAVYDWLPQSMLLNLRLSSYSHFSSFEVMFSYNPSSNLSIFCNMTTYILLNPYNTATRKCWSKFLIRFLILTLCLPSKFIFRKRNWKMSINSMITHQYWKKVEHNIRPFLSFL